MLCAAPNCEKPMIFCTGWSVRSMICTTGQSAPSSIRRVAGDWSTPEMMSAAGAWRNISATARSSRSAS